MREIVLADIKPFGNLDSTLEQFDAKIKECENDGYSTEVGRLLKLIVDLGLADIKDWFDEIETEADRPEIEMIVLLGQMFIIRLNNIAQKHINNIDMESMVVQLAQNPEIKKYFPDVIFKAIT